MGGSGNKGSVWRAAIVSGLLHAIPLILVWPTYEAMAGGPRPIPPLAEVSIDNPIEDRILDTSSQPTLAHGPSHGPTPEGQKMGAVALDNTKHAIELPREAAEPGPALKVDDDAPESRDSAVQGKGRVPVGSVTQYEARSPEPVYAAEARADGDGDGDGDGGGGGATDLTRLASLGGDQQWTCPYAFQGGENAKLRGLVVVHAKADVRADGSPGKVIVLDAPSPTFASNAARCALRERFATALDQEGKPIRGWTKRFRVVFSRW